MVKSIDSPLSAPLTSAVSITVLSSNSPCSCAAVMKLIDVSVPLDGNLPTYPGNVPFSLEPTKRIARGDSSNVSALHLSAHTGTHVDAPRHFFDNAAGTDAPLLEMLLGRTRVIEVTTRRGIGPDDLSSVDLSEELRLLIKTHNSRFWGSAEFQPGYIGVTDAGARHLIEHGIKVLGVDYLSVEELRSPAHPRITSCSACRTIVIEGLNSGRRAGYEILLTVADCWSRSARLRRVKSPPELAACYDARRQPGHRACRMAWASGCIR